MSVLTIESLSFGFQHALLFDKVELTLGPGEIVHLSGHNGAGKSTFLSIIAGLRSQTKGDVFCTIDGARVENRRTYVEYLAAESNGLYGHLDAVSNLEFWTSLRGRSLPRETIINALKTWGLGNALVREDFPVGKYSTGMKRRLALARISLSSCPIWLMDEPVYGLDNKGIELFRRMLVEHKSAGGSCLIVSHDRAAIDGLVTSHLSLGGDK
jgi:heme exporter protein A